jgi:hypothetical protein
VAVAAQLKPCGGETIKMGLDNSPNLSLSKFLDERNLEVNFVESSLSGPITAACDTPKTIHRQSTTRSGSCSTPKKRGRGAPPGNLNALKTGRYAAKARATRKQTWEITSRAHAIMRLVEALYGFGTTRYRPPKQHWPVLPESLRRKYREKARE